MIHGVGRDAARIAARIASAGSTRDTAAQVA
jgi:hypothetical protein